MDLQKLLQETSTYFRNIIVENVEIKAELN
jgi:hypothetical protein